ncbi:TRAP transporter small permease subunit [Arcobacter sp. FWKO B]|uniref:TRAP transporter small permease subunit n=1 Tax=Arcobacter sp. FWKO B TaxID=2593672 RepID=UPI0018A61F45|nr:TRAP transporter small permease subunit [Arcobacter sp. FWKO B]QOG11946.1 TRAP transporter small permease subunit [Arcobacter sp. FWKO B]
MKILNKIKTILDSISKALGAIGAVLVVALAFLILYNVISRYLFSSSFIYLQELEWHLFSIIFMLGLSYTLYSDAHVRVDIFYEKFSPFWQGMVNIIGVVLLLIPLSVVIIYTSIEPVMYAYEIKEGSPDPGGLPYRFIIKALIPLSFALLILSSLAFIIKQVENMVLHRQSKHSIEDKL